MKVGRKGVESWRLNAREDASKSSAPLSVIGLDPDASTGDVINYVINRTGFADHFDSSPMKER